MGALHHCSGARVLSSNAIAERHSQTPLPFFPMAMAALSCLAPLTGRQASACLGFLRATALHSSNSSAPAAAAARLSVAASNSECGLRSSSFASWRVCGDEERFSGAGVRTEQRRAIIVKAADQGAIDSPLMSSMTSKIKDSLKAQEVSVVDAYGDGRHVSIDVIAEAFEGQTRVSRQRMVYKAIWEELQSAVHAVDQLRTRTPAEAAEAGKKL